MKKVLVLAAAIALFATPALAEVIANSKHNLASGSTNTIKGSSAEICVYCHTPHAANMGVAGGFAPLWNRTGGDATTDFYNTTTLDAVTSIAGVNNSDAPLCLSCHDGQSLTLALFNPPNSGGTNPATNIGATSSTNLGLDLSNDHPVGFDYAAAAAIDLEIRATPNMGLNVTYGSGNDMWCSSCHDVHNDQYAPFLATTNAASAMCLGCHIK